MNKKKNGADLIIILVTAIVAIEISANNN